MFCSENKLRGVISVFWLSEGSRPTGSMAVFPASAEEADRILENQLVKLGGQIAFAGEFQGWVGQPDTVTVNSTATTNRDAYITPPVANARVTTAPRHAPQRN